METTTQSVKKTREERNHYLREWRAKHADNIKKHNATAWEKISNKIKTDPEYKKQYLAYHRSYQQKRKATKEDLNIITNDT